MTNAYHRKKEPEIIRRKLLESAVRLAAENPIGGFNLQAVAASAGVTKGGLLHHFPSKEILTEAVFLYLLQKIDRDLDAAMAGDPLPHGSFTRAYVHSIFRASKEENRTWNALSVSLLMDVRLGALWENWQDNRKKQHQDTDGSPLLEAVRLAADGIWLQDLNHVPYLWNGRETLLTQLIAITEENQER